MESGKLNAAPGAREACFCRHGDKTHRLRRSQKAFITTGIRSPRRAAWAVRVTGRGGRRQDPHQSCLGSLTSRFALSRELASGLVCMAQGVSLNRPLLDKTRDNSYTDTTLMVHHIRKRSTLIIKHEERCTGVYWTAYL